MSVCISCQKNIECATQKKFEKFAVSVKEVRFCVDIFYCKNYLREVVKEHWTKSIPAYRSGGAVVVKQDVFMKLGL